jgi:hypothetical protein
LQLLGSVFVMDFGKKPLMNPQMKEARGRYLPRNRRALSYRFRC